MVVDRYARGIVKDLDGERLAGTAREINAQRGGCLVLTGGLDGTTNVVAVGVEHVEADGLIDARIRRAVRQGDRATPRPSPRPRRVKDVCMGMFLHCTGAGEDSRLRNSRESRIVHGVRRCDG